MKNIEWNTVTWYSKLIALFLFFSVLMIGVYIGSEFQKLIITDPIYTNKQNLEYPKKATSNKIVYFNGGQMGQFTNEEVGLQFEFDSTSDGYILTEPENINSIKTLVLESAHDQNQINSEGGPTITIEVFNPGPNTTPNDWISSYEHSNYISGSILKNVEIDNKTAVNYTWDGLYQGETTTLAHKGWIYSISVMYNDKNSKIYTDYQTLLSSIKILVIK